jgi:hypothetical protein
VRWRLRKERPERKTGHMEKREEKRGKHDKSQAF